MFIVGQNPAHHITNYSRQFKGDFLQLLRTTHGEKRVHANHFYASQYIANKNHVHMNGTQWKTLTEFITFLGHERICRVENTENGWFINWIDKSPKVTKKRDATMKRERLEKGEADLEDRLIEEQMTAQDRKLSRSNWMQPCRWIRSKTKISKKKRMSSLRCTVGSGSRGRENGRCRDGGPTGREASSHLSYHASKTSKHE